MLIADRPGDRRRMTILLVLGTSALGALAPRHEGTLVEAFRADLAAGRPPGNNVTEGLWCWWAASFMLGAGLRLRRDRVGCRSLPRPDKWPASDCWR